MHLDIELILKKTMRIIFTYSSVNVKYLDNVKNIILTKNKCLSWEQWRWEDI